MKTRFFCESCGAEVSRHDKRCPSCGKTFTAVKCPRCGFEGGAKRFAGGCPVCGYLNIVPPESPDGGPRKPPARKRAGQRVRSFSLPRLAFPLRFYRVAVAVLLGLLAVLVAVLAVVIARR
jgi:hypothetical protein